MRSDAVMWYTIHAYDNICAYISACTQYDMPIYVCCKVCCCVVVVLTLLQVSEIRHRYSRCVYNSDMCDVWCVMICDVWCDCMLCVWRVLCFHVLVFCLLVVVVQLLLRVWRCYGTFDCLSCCVCLCPDVVLLYLHC